jgi:hypothetical protein
MESIVAGALPEERELAAKREQFAALESELVQAELERETLQAELLSLEREYLATVGIRLAQLDELQAKIAEAIARQRPKDSDAVEHASRARVQATETAAAFEGVADERGQRPQFKSSEDLRTLYLQVAKAVHPDLTTDETEKARRHEYMAAANEAYQQGDVARLKAIIEEWRSSPEAIIGEDTGAELIRTIRKIAQIEVRLAAIRAEVATLCQSEVFKLREKVLESRAVGRDLLEVIADEVDVQIRAAKKRLSELAMMETGNA